MGAKEATQAFRCGCRQRLSGCSEGGRSDEQTTNAVVGQRPEPGLGSASPTTNVVAGQRPEPGLASAGPPLDKGVRLAADPYGSAPSSETRLWRKKPLRGFWLQSLDSKI